MHHGNKRYGSRIFNISSSYTLSFISYFYSSVVVVAIIAVCNHLYIALGDNLINMLCAADAMQNNRSNYMHSFRTIRGTQSRFISCAHYMWVIFVCYVKYLAWQRRCWVLRRRKLNHREMELNRGEWNYGRVHAAVGVLAKQKLISSVAISSAISLGQQFKLLNWLRRESEEKNWLESFQMDYLKVNLHIERPTAAEREQNTKLLLN